MEIPTGAYPDNHIDPPEYEDEEDIGLINKLAQIDVFYESLKEREENENKKKG
jgi:hypothetical protein